MNGAVQIVNTSMMLVGSNVITSASWQGGLGALVISAQQFAPVVNLMYLAGNGRSIKMNSTALQADAVIGMQLPAGQYQIHSATGSSVGMYAAICPTP